MRLGSQQQELIRFAKEFLVKVRKHSIDCRKYGTGGILQIQGGSQKQVCKYGFLWSRHCHDFCFLCCVVCQVAHSHYYDDNSRAAGALPISLYQDCLVEFENKVKSFMSDLELVEKQFAISCR